MLALKKITAFASLAVLTSFEYVRADADLDELDNETEDDAAPAGGMPNIDDMMKNLPEGMSEEQMKELMEKMQGMDGMPGADGAAPPAPEVNVVSNSTELEAAISARTSSNALYVFTGASEKVKATAEKTLATEGLFGSVTYLAEGETSLKVYKGEEEIVAFEGDVEDAEAASKWALENRVPTFGQIDGSNFEIYFNAAKKGLFWACFDPSKNDEQVKQFNAAFVEASKAHQAAGKNETFPFVWLNVKDFEEHAKNDLGCKTFPTIVLQRGDLMSEAEDVVIDKYLRSFEGKEETLTAEGIAKFFADVESGELKAEPIPDPLDAMDDDEDEDEESAAPAQAEEEL